MIRFKQRWNQFWFEPTDARDLGFTRLFILSGAFLYYYSLNFTSWAFVHKSFWEVIPLFQHMHWHVLPTMWMWILGAVWKLAMLSAAIGFFTRFSAAVAFLLSLYLLGLPNNVGKVDHNDMIMVWSFLIFAIARSGDAWSIDALIRSAKNPPDDVTRPLVRQTSAEYRWPLQLMRVFMAMVFCMAGIAKMRYSGFAWVFSDNMRNIFLGRAVFSTTPLSLGIWIASHHWLCVTLAGFSLLMELSAPLALLNPWVALFVIGSLFSMQLGNQFLLGIDFRQFMLVYAVWIPWTHVVIYVRGGKPAIPRATVFFDGSCGLCKRTMAILRRLDLVRAVRIVDITRDWDRIAAEFPMLDQQECFRTMHVVAAKQSVTQGFYAYRALCRYVPVGWFAWPVLFVPGVPTVGSAVYERVANRRYNNGCGVNDKPTAVSG